VDELQVVALTQLPALLARHQPHPAVQELERRRPRSVAFGQLHASPKRQQRLLERLTPPTLLIVGALDPQVLELNRRAAGRLTCPHRLAVVPGAGHLFEEPGALDEVAGLAGTWFNTHLR
jgi:pimeloyl-ACP methyl ester carboxylesterase